MQIELFDILTCAGATFLSGAGAGYIYGRVVGKTESKTTFVKQKQEKNDNFSYILKGCDTLSRNNRSPLSQLLDVKIFYKKHKIVTNDCSALQGKNCSYTGKRCYLL